MATATAQQRAADLRAELADLRRQGAESVEAYERAEDALGQAVTRAGVLGQRVDAARADADASTEQARDRIAALYRAGGRTGLLSTLADASSAQDLVSRVANVSAIVDADTRVREQVDASRTALEQAQTQATAAAVEQVRLVGTMQAETVRVAELLAQQERALADADAQVRRLVEEQRRAAREQAARDLAAAQAAQAAQRASAQAAAAAEQLAAQVTAQMTAQVTGLPGEPGGSPTSPGTSPSSGTGPGPADYAGPPAACPVGAAHSFTDTWGAPRSGGRRHQGTDVFAPLGAPAYAVVDGVIDKTGDGGLGGITLWLRAADGDRYYYAHNSRNLVGVGDRVRAGQVIALVGTSGNAETTPAHIHFQAHPGGGQAANPYPWLAAICAG